MITRSKFILIGIISLLTGSALTTPLLFSELDIVPFWTVPEGPKANLSVSVVYANFTIQEPTSRYDANIGEHNQSIFDYYIVLNVTNHSDLTTKVSDHKFAAALDITVTPSALGGFHGKHQGTMTFGSSGISSGPAEGYIGHVGEGRVEGLWLDGEWINVTWVPEGGLDEIWHSEDAFPPKGLEDIWEPTRYPPSNYNPGNDDPPFIPYGGTQSNNTAYYTYSGTKFHIGGGNYWIEGVPLKEYIADNEVKSTIIYFNGSWIDVTGRVEAKERPFLTAEDMLVQMQTSFMRILRENGAPSSGISLASSDSDHSNIFLSDGFDNTWEPYQSRLILLNGSLDVSSLWKDNELLKEGEITLFVEVRNYLKDYVVDGIYLNTVSTASELKTVQLEINEESYLYNTILSGDQTFDTNLSGIEVFVVQGKET